MLQNRAARVVADVKYTNADHDALKLSEMVKSLFHDLNNFPCHDHNTRSAATGNLHVVRTNRDLK